MTVLVLLLAAALPAELLQVTVTGPDAAVPGMLQVRPTDVVAPDFPLPDLPVMPGWPIQVSSNAQFGPARGVALADLDGDGRLEVIAASTGNQLHVWRHDGTYYPGWPRSLSAMGQYAPAVADIDCDGEYEIAVCTRGQSSGGALQVFTESGAPKPGWPFTGLVGGNFNDSPTLADLDGDDTLEVIAGERDYPIGHLHVLTHRGTPYPGAWPCSLDHVPAMGAAVGDLDRDGEPDIVTSSYNSLYAFRADGSLLPGWPCTNPNGGYFSYQSPALADVDEDDTLEIAVAEHRDGAGAYVFRRDGALQPGWPYRFPRWTYCPPSVCDLFRDGSLKVICGLSGVMGGAAAVQYAFSAAGAVLPGFPVTQPNGDAAEGNTAVADLDADGDMEIIYTSNMMLENKGFIFACHHDGSPVTGWPLRPDGFTYQAGATVGDVDGDDSLDIVVTAASGATMSVTVYEAGVPFSRASWEWPTYQFDMARTGLYRRYQTGVEEGRKTPNAARETPTATVVRGVLHLPVSSFGIRHSSLVDAVGRRLLDLRPGPNDVSHLSPGIYFIQSTFDDRRSTMSKVVLAR